MATRIGILLLALVLPHLCLADEAYPPLTERSLVGVWEAIASDWVVQRLDIRASGESYFAEVGGIHGDTHRVYRLAEKRIHSGRVVLRFRKLIGGWWEPVEITLRGQGYALDGEGEFQATFASSDTRSSSYNVTYQKGTRTRILAKLSKQAERLVPR
jgi:hypothetical protein